MLKVYYSQIQQGSLKSNTNSRYNELEASIVTQLNHKEQLYLFIKITLTFSKVEQKHTVWWCIMYVLNELNMIL